MSEISIKVDLGFIDEFEIRLDYDSYSSKSVAALRWGKRKNCITIGMVEDGYLSIVVY